MKSDTTVLIAVGCAPVREALAAMFNARDGFQVVAEVDTEEAAIEAARAYRPVLALVEPELSGDRGWWVMQQIQSEGLARALVALGRRMDTALARLVGADLYLQMGTSPSDLRRALDALVAARQPHIDALAHEADGV